MSRAVLAIVAAVSAVLALVGVAGAADFGANDDTGKYLADESAPYFEQMAALGLKVNVMTLRWNPADPELIEERARLDEAVPLAALSGVRVVFSLYGAKPTSLTSDGGKDWQFAAWAAQVARSYPTVREFIVGNEPNQPRFWRPQFSRAGGQVSAAAFGPVLAKTYDALKAVDPEIKVIGLGLSPRGNDNPLALENVSTSPVRFLRALGAWYRASGRTEPIMDALSFHPYPNSNIDPLLRGYPWPNAGVANLGRIKQAVWDAFNGTAQPTVVNGLTFYLDELGWQVDTAGSDAYTGTENVPVTDEQHQAEIYGELVRVLGCDPTVAAVNLFGFQDDLERTGFQAGLLRRDGSERPAAQAVKDALAETQGGCLGPLTSWRVARGVIGASAQFPFLGAYRRAAQTSYRFTATAQEETWFVAGIFRLGTTKAQIDTRLAADPAPRGAAHGRLKAYKTPPLKIPTGHLAPGRYIYGIRLAATMNPERSTVLTSRPFRVIRGTA
jgi:hypothetical protein